MTSEAAELTIVVGPSHSHRSGSDVSHMKTLIDRTTAGGAKGDRDWVVDAGSFIETAVNLTEDVAAWWDSRYGYKTSLKATVTSQNLIVEVDSFDEAITATLLALVETRPTPSPTNVGPGMGVGFQNGPGPGGQQPFGFQAYNSLNLNGPMNVPGFGNVFDKSGVFNRIFDGQSQQFAMRVLNGFGIEYGISDHGNLRFLHGVSFENPDERSALMSHPDANQLIARCIQSMLDGTPATQLSNLYGSSL